MKFVKLSKEELHQIAKLYEEVMSTAYEGLFFREGKVIGEGIMEVVPSEEQFEQKAAKIIKARGWVDEIELEEERAVVDGSIEVREDQDTPTCHRLRGMLAIIYQEGTGNMVEVNEVSCESVGDDQCEFEINIKAF